jgi:glycosyltransferase involved in cell wall biosynthesis
MCTYNGEKFLRPQIDSILAQTYPNIELLVVDDASTDNTRLLLEEYRNKDKRIKIYFNEKNLGYNRNFEKAFSLASAEYIAISDQDDIWEKDKIEKMMKNWLPGSLFNFSLSGTFYGDDWENRQSAPVVNYQPITHLFQLVFSSPVHGHASMFKKELLAHSTPFPENVYYDWWLSMHAVSISTLGCTPQTLTWHRRHRDNSSRNILSLQDKEERNAKLRAQFIEAIDTFIKTSPSLKKEDEFLIEYTSILKKMDGKKISSAMLACIMKNRKKIFHYKKNKPLLFFSHLKHAMRMGRTGVL